jgi:hypothetical protein
MAKGDKHKERLQESYAEWLKYRTILEAYRVGPSDRRTTPPPACDVSEVFPELAKLRKTTVRLHPRYGDEPPVDASKLGGTFLWPSKEPWPTCSVHGIPLVTVLQLRASDFPEMPFPPGADLFQVLWCPREHEENPDRPDQCPMYWADPQFFWRSLKKIRLPRPDNPPPQEAYYEYVPYTCRLLPERVIEYPAIEELPDDLVQRIEEWEDQNLDENGIHACEYEAELSVAYGTKIGGHVRSIQYPQRPICNCGRPMEHLLTIATTEWNGMRDPRWTPFEEQEKFASFPSAWDELTEEHTELFRALWIPTGLSLGDAGHMQLFMCLHCRERPIEPVIECC